MFEHASVKNLCKISMFYSKPSFLVKPLSFIQCKMLSKLCLSCIELKICTGGYTRLLTGTWENLQSIWDRLCLVNWNCLKTLHFCQRSNSWDKLNLRQCSAQIKLFYFIWSSYWSQYRSWCSSWSRSWSRPWSRSWSRYWSISWTNSWSRS